MRDNTPKFELKLKRELSHFITVTDKSKFKKLGDNKTFKDLLNWLILYFEDSKCILSNISRKNIVVLNGEIDQSKQNKNTENYEYVNCIIYKSDLPRFLIGIPNNIKIETKDVNGRSVHYGDTKGMFLLNYKHKLGKDWKFVYDDYTEKSTLPGFKEETKKYNNIKELSNGEYLLISIKSTKQSEKNRILEWLDFLS